MFSSRQNIDMAEVALQSCPSQFSSSASASSLPISPPQPRISSFALQESDKESCDGDGVEREGEQISILAFLMTAFRRSIAGCSVTDSDDFCSMEIGLPTNVRHIAHVTFDRFNGFLGLPVEFERDVPRRAPSASATVFGVSTESMQLSYDSRGNSVPTILLMMQRHLYAHAGLEAEGIFRITAGNSQEEFVREQLNLGVIPEDVDAHCLAGLIKAWFRELPSGVLDPLSPDDVMQCQTEEDCVLLAKHLPPTEAALLDWAVNLMADVTQMEHFNKMNSRNIAMVFAPNMTQMSDPLTALMYAVQVMNMLKALIERTVRDREEKSRPSDKCGKGKPSDERDPGCSTQMTYNEGEDGDDEVEVGRIEAPKRKRRHPPKVLPLCPQKGKGSFIVAPIDPRSQMFEAWR